MPSELAMRIATNQARATGLVPDIERAAAIIDAEVAPILSENERLRTIVRVRTHRDKGCLCERCIADEYEQAAAIEKLEQELASYRSVCNVSGESP